MITTFINYPTPGGSSCNQKAHQSPPTTEYGHTSWHNTHLSHISVNHARLLLEVYSTSVMVTLFCADFQTKVNSPPLGQLFPIPDPMCNGNLQGRMQDIVKGGSSYCAHEAREKFSSTTPTIVLATPPFRSRLPLKRAATRKTTLGCRL